MPMNRYDVTYAFDDTARKEYSDPIKVITATVSSMQNENIEIDFLGAIQEINANGDSVKVTARYTASTKGEIGRCNCRAQLPASGPPKSSREIDSPADQSGSTRSTNV